MSNKVTFAVGTNSVESRVVESFTFKQLGIDENLDDKEIQEIVDKYFKEWVWSTISHSCVISRPSKDL